MVKRKRRSEFLSKKKCDESGERYRSPPDETEVEIETTHDNGCEDVNVKNKESDFSNASTANMSNDGELQNRVNFQFYMTNAVYK